MSQETFIKEPISKYTRDYKQAVFLLWYNGGRLSPAKLRKLLQESEEEMFSKYTIPHVATLLNWIKSDGMDWKGRADFMDSEARRRMEELIIEEKVLMFQRQADMGKEMQDVGVAYIKEHGVESASGALRAIQLGVDIEKSSRGVPDAIKKLATLSDTKLQDKIKQLLAKVPVEVYVEDDEGSIDGEFRETE